MATLLIHPLTGVKLNPVIIERVSLNFDEALTVWLLRMQGMKYHKAAAMLGANTHRLGEVLRGEAFPGAEQIARDRLYKRAKD